MIINMHIRVNPSPAFANLCAHTNLKRFNMKRILKFIGLAMPERKQFFEVMKEYVSRYILENQLTPETANHYTQRQTNIHLFLAQSNLMSICLDEIKPKHMEDLRIYLLQNLKTCSRRHASRHIDLCKNVMKYALKCEYVSVDHLSPIVGQRDKPKPIIHLTLTEVRRLLSATLPDGIVSAVAKRFAFQCFTGLSHCEVDSFKLVNLNGRTWIDSTREKTGKSEYVYLFDEAKAILDHFGGQIPPIPNQTCNRILKEIAAIVGINKHLTTHIGRKTHATILDELGVSLETIARQLRNTERICRESYTAKSHLRTEHELERVGLMGAMIKSVSLHKS